MLDVPYIYGPSLPYIYGPPLPYIYGPPLPSSPVRTALYQSFMAARLHHPTSKDVQPPVEHLLQLCTLTSDILKTCVREALQENSNTAEGGLHQVRTGAEGEGMDWGRGVGKDWGRGVGKDWG